MSTTETTRFVRLRVELVLEVADEDAVVDRARRRIAEDGELGPEERRQLEGAVTEDTAEALAYLVDPVVLAEGIPGVELQQASWSSEHIEYDPDAPDWELDEDDERAGDDEEGEEEDGGGGVDRREHPGFPG
ncbi:hypothetical protein STXM2123_4009 [Streptomyces sp. F-3]|uniref:Uncharacterized protein n=1 Tax=Streptomyces thermogriseus TaxID=75292 RepID=A0ABP4DDB1_9ACTN|nr:MULTISPECIES: hypothetical protein [Streptomyces]MDN5382871.1 hypothetical protein [Streptomyces sp. LB8]GAT83308.1 hypothetical protein STXM2123_4009 [Streptomyces sp. F-3]